MVSLGPSGEPPMESDRASLQSPAEVQYSTHQLHALNRVEHVIPL